MPHIGQQMWFSDSTLCFTKSSQSSQSIPIILLCVNDEDEECVKDRDSRSTTLIRQDIAVLIFLRAGRAIVMLRVVQFVLNHVMLALKFLCASLVSAFHAHDLLGSLNRLELHRGHGWCGATAEGMNFCKMLATSPFVFEVFGALLEKTRETSEDGEFGRHSDLRQKLELRKCDG